MKTILPVATPPNFTPELELIALAGGAGGAGGGAFNIVDADGNSLVDAGGNNLVWSE